MDEGTTLETTEAATRDLARYLRTVPEVVNFTGYVGLASPMDFNGLVRHYFLRKGDNVADLRVNLLPKESARAAVPRNPAAHPARLGSDRKSIWGQDQDRRVAAGSTGHRHGYGRDPWRIRRPLRHVSAGRADHGRAPQERTTGGRTWTPQSKPTKTNCLFATDKEKGCAIRAWAPRTSPRRSPWPRRDSTATTLNIPTEVSPLPVILRLPRELRSSPESLASLYISGRPGIAKAAPGGQPARRARAAGATRRVGLLSKQERGQNDLSQKTSSAWPTSSPKPPAGRRPMWYSTLKRISNRFG